MTIVFARIILRYLAGAMMALGYFTPEIADQIATDPDLLMLVGTGLAIGTETVYAMAKKFGWAT